MSSSIAALTTTFTPAASCTQLMFSAPIYKVWLDEPIPMSGSTLTDCYPTEFLNGYASASPSSSIAPMMSPLICPSGWTAAFRTSTSYIACCPSSYNLRVPDSTVDTNRPAYGGTCFSDITSGQTFTVTQYTDSSIFQVQTISSTLQSGQAFAHPMDGIDQQAVVRATPTPSPTAMPTGIALDTTEVPPPPATDTTSPTAGFIPIASSPIPPSNSSAAVSSNLSTGDIIGIAVGIVGIIAMIGAIILFICVRRRGKETDTPSQTAPEVVQPQSQPAPPPPPEKDYYYAHSNSNSIRSGPSHEEKQSYFGCQDRSSPISPAISPGPSIQAMRSAYLQPISPRTPVRTPKTYTYHSRNGDRVELSAHGDYVAEIYSPTRESRMETRDGRGIYEAGHGTESISTGGMNLSHYERNLRTPPRLERSGASSLYEEDTRI